MNISLAQLGRQFTEFVTHAHRLKRAYASTIRLLVGLETECITPLDLDLLSQLLACHDQEIDLLVGSVHHVNGIPIDYDKPTYERCLASISPSFSSDGVASNTSEHDNMEAYLEKYFDAQYEVLSRFHPEVVGHIDLCRLYVPTLNLRLYRRAWVKLERNVKFAIEYGALFEANAAALRKGWDASYPGRDVLKVRTSCAPSPLPTNSIAAFTSLS
jgi:histidinol-phosphatase (PHP family)